MKKGQTIYSGETSRRSFLQKMSLGVGAALAGPALSSLANAQSLSTAAKPLGIALVGLGSYSTHQLAPALQQTQFCRLAGIVTGTPSKAEEWSKKYNLPKNNIYTYDTFDRIANNPDIDIVYVVLPNAMHAEYVIRAAKAGKHVICEKPMAVSVKECEAMIAACKAAKRQLSIGYRLHFEPHTKEVMRLGQHKVFGAVKIIETSDGFRAGDPKQWRLNKALSGGGSMMDIGIYALQGARYITGEEPLSVLAQEYKTDPVKFKEGIDETIIWQMKFPSGAVSTSTSTYAANVERLYATAENGWFELGPAFGYGPIKGRTSKGEMNFPHINHQAAQMDAFADCILNNKPTTVPGEEGLKDMKVIEAIYESARTGKLVTLK